MPHKTSQMQQNGEETSRDGRSMRAERNRRLVAEASLQLLEEGEAQPTAQMIARKSGVSTSTIFRLYEDLEAIRDTVIQSRLEQVKHLLIDVPRELPLEERITQLVNLRSQFYEKVAPIRRLVAPQRSTSELINKILTMNESAFFTRQKNLFADEIAGLRSGDEILQAVDNLMSWESWDRLRSIQKLSIRKSKQVLTAALTRLLTE
ncbi:MAG: TetR/AcrR family transcriptional regulator [Candidatus Azotimanducaceae bacterium]